MVLTEDDIRARIPNGLITCFKDEQLEAASYDLRVGTIIWKTAGNQDREHHISMVEYDTSSAVQNAVTIQPGQVVFVITLEEISMPDDLCGTVYAKNKFSRDGILAWTTGHIDPLVRCPIIIRLINLRSIPFTLKPGDPIYTIVFERLTNPIINTLSNPNRVRIRTRTITMSEAINTTIESANAALGNALQDISLTQQFVRKDDVGNLIWDWVRGNILKTVGIIAAIIGWVVAVMEGVTALIEHFKK